MGTRSTGQLEPVDRTHEESLDDLLRQVARFTDPPAFATRSVLPPGTKLAGDRLSIVRLIGEGGMGLVYEAFDTERRSLVALKALSRLDAAGVYRLKNEFRALADVSHPNLVRLHDLFADGEQWFFTMELVDGGRIDRWVHAADERDGADDGHEPRAVETHVRALLPQLLAAIDAIHAAGKLHRDLKPSNVLVTSTGRVVVLDFGLATEREPGGVGQTLRNDGVSGTPAYMAPEQAAGEPASRASDLYALGAMLFELIARRLPFSGLSHDILADKQRLPAPPLREICPEAPPDLSALCDQLLQRDPAARPDSAEIARRLGLTHAAAGQPATHGAAGELEPLIGREPELRQLRAAYEASCTGQPVVVWIRGESGIGKSALVTGLLDELRSEGHAVLLAGRCHERELVPFKGVDSVIDELSRWLRRLPREQSAALLPREVSALARLFPVLGRIDAIAQAPERPADAQEQRLRAFAALAELLARIRDRRPLVVHVDDVQWLDRDGALLIGYLFEQPEPVPALFVLSQRDEGTAASSFLRERLRRNPSVQLHELALAGLAVPAARELAQRLLAGAPAAQTNDIALQSGGSPFLLAALARLARGQRAGAGITLDQALLAEVRALSAPAQDLLSVLALAGRPLSLPIALDAARARHEQLDELRAARLLRTHGGEAEGALECYHDKIRECVTRSLAEPEARALHAELLAVLSARDGANAEQLALHAEGAGQRETAARHAAAAAQAASEALAFDHAAALYRRALDLGQHDEAARRALLRKLGAALTDAGRGHEAAHAYLSAAEGLPEHDRFELERLAAEQLLYSGHIDEGKALLAKVLKTVGLALPSGPRAALATVLWERARLKLRGLAFRPRTDPLAPERQRELDALLAAAPLSSIDVYTGAALSCRYARLALDSGLARHAFMGLGIEAIFVAVSGGERARGEVAGLLERSAQLARVSGLPEAPGVMHMMRGTVAQLLCLDMGEVERDCREAIAALRARGKVDANTLGVLYSNLHVAGDRCGRFPPVAESTALVDEAWRRGDLYSAITLIHSTTTGRLFQGDVAGLTRHLEQAREAWRRPRDYCHLDTHLMTVELMIAHYLDQPERALECMQRDWPAIERAQLLRGDMLRLALHGRRAKAACLTAEADPGRAPGLLALARRDVRQLDAIRLAPVVAGRTMLRCLLLRCEGRIEAAIALGRAGAAGWEHAGWHTSAIAARRHLGLMIGGEEGASLTAAADVQLRAMGAVDPVAAARIM